jgi:hypothetical protein
MMDFRLRIMGLTALLAALIGLFLGGMLFSPGRSRARDAARPLLALGSPAGITAMDIHAPGRAEMSLARNAGGWTMTSGGRQYPASTARAEGLARLLCTLARGGLASRDAARAGLGLDDAAARRLVVHLGGGKPDVGLFVGSRAPGGEEDYIQVRGQTAAYLVRGNLSILLGQDRAYWLDLAVLPGGLEAADVTRISVTGHPGAGRESFGPAAGALTSAYVLLRSQDGQGWSIQGGTARVDPLLAAAMADALAVLEGEDITESGARVWGETGASVTVEVGTRSGASYAIQIVPSDRPGSLLAVPAGSVHAYLINPAVLSRAVRPVAELLAQ